MTLPSSLVLQIEVEPGNVLDFELINGSPFPNAEYVYDDSGNHFSISFSIISHNIYYEDISVSVNANHVMIGNCTVPIHNERIMFSYLNTIDYAPFNLKTPSGADVPVTSDKLFFVADTLKIEQDGERFPKQIEIVLSEKDTLSEEDQKKIILYYDSAAKVLQYQNNVADRKDGIRIFLKYLPKGYRETSTKRPNREFRWALRIYNKDKRILSGRIPVPEHNDYLKFKYLLDGVVNEFEVKGKIFHISIRVMDMKRARTTIQEPLLLRSDAEKEEGGGGEEGEEREEGEEGGGLKPSAKRVKTQKLSSTVAVVLLIEVHGSILVKDTPGAENELIMFENPKEMALILHLKGVVAGCGGFSNSSRKKNEVIIERILKEGTKSDEAKFDEVVAELRTELKQFYRDIQFVKHVTEGLTTKAGFVDHELQPLLGRMQSSASSYAEKMIYCNRKEISAFKMDISVWIKQSDMSFRKYSLLNPDHLQELFFDSGIYDEMHPLFQEKFYDFNHHVYYMSQKDSEIDEIYVLYSTLVSLMTLLGDKVLIIDNSCQGFLMVNNYSNKINIHSLNNREPTPAQIALCTQLIKDRFGDEDIAWGGGGRQRQRKRRRKRQHRGRNMTRSRTQRRLQKRRKTRKMGKKIRKSRR